jgi:hypothetical protein
VDTKSTTTCRHASADDFIRAELRLFGREQME